MTGSGGDWIGNGERVVVNVGGQRYITCWSTLRALPNTRLSTLSPDDPSYDAGRGEYFFDHNPRLFPYVLDAYREGELHFPQCVCGPAMRRELAWWGLGEDILATCCLQAVAEWEQTARTLDEISHAFCGGMDRALGGMESNWEIPRTRASPWNRRASRTGGATVTKEATMERKATVAKEATVGRKATGAREDKMVRKSPTRSENTIAGSVNISRERGSGRTEGTHDTMKVPRWTKGLAAKKNQIWFFLEEPNSSTAAKVWSYIFTLLILISVLVVCFDTLPAFRIPRTALVNHPSYNLSLPAIADNPKLTMYLTTKQHPAMFYLNHVCSLLIGLELAVRFVVCPSKKRFFCSFFNIIDILAVVPTAIASLITLVDIGFWLQHDLTVNYVIFTLTSIFRAVRLIKLMKQYRGLRVMFLALKASAPEMLLLMLLLLIAILIFSTTVYFAELRNPDMFHSIPVGFWWSAITMTTVGYGDVYPCTAWGQVIGAVCAVTGMLITGLPIPLIAANFHLYHSSAKLHNKLLQRRVHGGTGRGKEPLMTHVAT